MLVSANTSNRTDVGSSNSPEALLLDTFKPSPQGNYSHLLNGIGQHENLSATEDSDVYDYDYDESVGHLPLDDLVPNAMGYGLTLVLGLTGNILVIISVARYRRMHNVTNIFLLSLATADLLLVSTCVPVKFARFFTFTWQYGEVLCKLVHYLQNLTIICSVLNLTGLSLERYYAILHPMRAKYTCTVTMARRFVILIWTMSVIMATPILIGQSQVLVGKKIQGYWCVEEWSPLMAKVYSLYMILVVFILPLGLMAYAYICICQRLWQVRYQHSTMRASQHHIRPERTITPLPSPQSGTETRCFLRTFVSIHGKRVGSLNEDTTRKQVVKMLVFVVILFAVCWGPIMVNNVLVSFDVIHRLNHGFLKPMRQAFWLMAYGNSCLNPIVYGFMSKNFRESFRNTFRMCLLRGSPRDIARHKALWRCSFQAPSALHVINRSPSVYDRAFLDPHLLKAESRPSMSSQGSTQMTHLSIQGSTQLHVKKTDEQEEALNFD